jgi:hypothetical protein
MLRPWVPLIALGLGLLLLWQLGANSLAWLGGGLLAAALLYPLLQGLGKQWRRERSLKKAEKLDWSIIDNSLSRDRVQRDCERQETLGICTGRECLVYEGCNFNIKKPLP